MKFFDVEKYFRLLYPHYFYVNAINSDRKEIKVPLTEEEVFEEVKNDPELVIDYEKKGVYWDRWHHKMLDEKKNAYRKIILNLSYDELQKNEVLKLFYSYDTDFIDANYKRRFRKFHRLYTQLDRYYIWLDKFDGIKEVEAEIEREIDKLEPMLFEEYKRVIRELIGEKG